MPYGMAKNVGGDTTQTDSLMESCVVQVTAKGTPKQEAIRICKARIQEALRRRQGG